MEAEKLHCIPFRQKTEESFGIVCMTGKQTKANGVESNVGLKAL